MDIVKDNYKGRTPHRILMIWLLIFICTGINFAGADIVNQLSLPIYLDCIGTMIAAIFGSYIPGALVGLFSATINGIMTDSKSMSYGMLSVLIALFVAWASENGWFKSLRKILLSVLICAFLGGTLGAFVTIALYGVGGGDQTQAGVQFLIDRYQASPFAAQIIADTFFDIIDKAISLTLVLVITKLFSESFKDDFKLDLWKQAPLKQEAIKTLINNKDIKFSIRIKIILLFGLGSTLVAVASVIISVILYKDSIYDFAKMAGISLNERSIEIRSITFLVNQISLFVGVFILIVTAFLYLAKYHLVLPLNTMAYVASKFSEHDIESLREMAELFNAIKISTDDETENLYKVLAAMTKENAEFMEALQKKSATISELQNSLIIVLADMVESRDHNTGDHIKTTAEYVEIIMDEMLTEGIYKDQLTAKFISDVYQSAPLHDIGKISVSDVILNKPGKLTDEEFAIMKHHTVAGAEILDRVIDTLPDSDGGYLVEARNLALYHHEKWNGQGYPFGISGQQIPLSARIMAVADVFDALVSKRSYKEAFSFEKAISIIEESAGSHFDPLIAQAFINAKDRIRYIAEEKDEINV